MSQAQFVWRLTSETLEKPQKLGGLFFYHAYCIWLFTYSDIHIILLPKTAFGVLHALWFTENSANNLVGPSSKEVIERIPLVLYWVWINLLAFNIGNQRGPKSVSEDAINKPWRPMPSGLWNPDAASMGFTSFGLGALEVALDQSLDFTTATLLDLSAPNLEQWILLLVVAVLSTVHTQDMHDQEGDKARGRSTMPIQIGDTPARWIIAGFMLLWGVMCPLFWRCGVLGYATSTSIAYIVVFRSFFLCTVRQDRMTFAIWNLWMVSLYALPLERLLNNYITR
ncbi:UbiA prenyltransferase family-domain-containing protein [Xylaria sp. FL0043]|nr:UbiA prenyltransferase family-domain-containing protein [Xylaria sp. FL0043]